VLDQEQTGASGSNTPDSTANAPLHPPPEFHSKEDFRVGQKVSFPDQSLKRHVGQITRTNQRTATVHCDGRAWWISFALLQHVVDVTA
jgi:hypothetical protein